MTDGGSLALGLLLIAGILVLLVLVAFLFWAPMKLYGIHKELRMLNDNFVLYARRTKEAQETQARLLVEISKAGGSG